MQKSRFSGRSVALGLGAAVVLARGASWGSTTESYVGLDQGVWSNAANWSGNLVPLNSSSQTFAVLLNSVSPTTTLLDTSTTIDTLTIGAGDGLSILPGITLTVAGGTTTNAGSILLNGTASASQLFFNSNTALTGGGMVILAGAQSAIKGGSNVQVTSDNLISGQGVINASLISAGSIIASTGTLTLTPNDASQDFVNTGTIRADGGSLLLESGNYANTNGTIEALNNSNILVGSQNNFNRTMITGGTLRALSGTVTLTNALLQNISLAGNIAFSHNQSFYGLLGTVNNSGTLTILDNSSLSLSNATVNNTGTFIVGQGPLSVVSDSFLTGGGTISLTDSSSAISSQFSGVRLTTDNCISGQGIVTNIKFTNLGTIRATTGTLTLFPFNSSDGLINGGALRADGGNIVLSYPATMNVPYVIQNAGGVIDARNGSQVQVKTNGNVTVMGGTLTTSTSGAISVSGGCILQDVSIAGTVIASTGQLTLNTDGNFTNTGMLQAQGTGNLVIHAVTGQLDNTGGTISVASPFSTNNKITGTIVGGTISVTGSSSAIQLAAYAGPQAFLRSVTLTSSNGGYILMQGSGSPSANLTPPSYTDITNTGLLVLDNGPSPYLSGTTVNSGTIQVYNSSVGPPIFPLSILNFQGQAILTGGGTVRLNTLSPTSSMHGVLSSPAGDHLTTDNTIIGSGQIGLNNLKITSTGSIIASNTSGIIVNPFNSTDGFYSTGLLRADHAPLAFSNSYFAISGTLEAIHGGTINFSSGVFSVACPITLADNSAVMFNATAQSVAAITGVGSATVGVGASLISDAVTVTNWTVNGMHVLRAGGVGVSKVSSLVVAGVLDVTNHDLIIGNASMGVVEGEILNGLGLGSGGGSIVSSTAVGDGDKYLVPVDAGVFGGVGGSVDGVVITDPNSIVIKYTYKGDVNLDGKVTTADYLVLNGNFGKTTPGLADMAVALRMGDVNLDGKVSTADYLVLNGNFGKGMVSPLAVSASSVPEPGSLAVLSLVAWAMLRRRGSGPKQDSKACSSGSSHKQLEKA